MRILGKKLRYASESRPPSSGRMHLESGLKRLQDALGSIQDGDMVVKRLDGLASADGLTPAVAGPARVAAANERDRRRRAFLEELTAGAYENLLHEVRNVAAKQSDGRDGRRSRDDDEGGSADRGRGRDSGQDEAQAERVALDAIPGIGAAKARRLAEAGLATSGALKAASLDALAAVRTIGAAQARVIKEYLDNRGNGDAGDNEADLKHEGAGTEPSPPDLDGKRFERTQAVLALAAAVSDYARTLGEELSRREEADAQRAGRQAERLVEDVAGLTARVQEISTKGLKSLRGELREAEGLLAKVLELDTGSLKMNKLRRALKAHRKALEAYLG